MKTREISDKLQDWQKQVGETAKTVSKATDEYVHENAWSSLAFAAVLGCVVGYLLGARRD